MPANLQSVASPKKQLFKSISDQSKVMSFKEKIPSMNDIFIMKVKEGGSDE